MSKDVWVRGVIDIGVIGSDTAYLLDWKTGKHRPDSDQLEVICGFGGLLYTLISNVVTGFIWLKDKKI